MICHTFDLIKFMAHNVTCLRVIYEGEIRDEQMCTNLRGGSPWVQTADYVIAIK